MPSPAETRARAAALLNRIIVRKETTDQVLRGAPEDPLLRELLFGCLRHYFSLAASIESALRQPMRFKDNDLKCLMIVGAYQLHHTRIPAHAALNETVAATRPLGKPWAKALVNAVLRNAPPPERSFEHPRWMRDALQAAYGDLGQAIMLANNERAPMTVRINGLRSSPQDYRAALNAAGIGYRAPRVADAGTIGWGPETLTLNESMPAARLPGYSEGQVAVQDAGAQLAAVLLGTAQPLPVTRRTERVLDACAAPGGKLFHLLEREPDLKAVALDVSARRLETMAREAGRLGHAGIDSRRGDATTLDWWDGVPFERVLIDAPCSGSGTLRRHPDIKLLRQAADLAGYTALQAQLLANLWHTLQPGGTLLYCTCSLFPTENDDVIGRFLRAEPQAIADRIVLPSGIATRHGWQLLPLDVDTDGFYYARLRKAAT